ncbi:WS/DGAT/MGAT family O-acyltransferase [Saccharomonospora halophila]|uniref:WS/DGAT/MGAT family O-acyltransferase n=1 Tax=Saccharomonospora halophila TaxID=129922 RepID=UPI00036B4AC6|nr:wax ester/triacylglycerol synthase family O-acyltransferase [Saccharomonospora halophila]
MTDRLSALDASFLYAERPATPLHVGGIAIVERPEKGFDYGQLLSLVGRRLAYLPRYRRRVRPVPGHLSRPVWVDDVDFDLNYHVRRSALPEPGNHRQLFELVARLLARPLDVERPLWELYMVEGLAGNRVALVTKTHQSMVDGIGSLDLGQLLLDDEPTEPGPAEEFWTARPRPGRVRLVTDAVADTVRRPAEMVENVRTAVRDVASTADRVLGAVEDVASAVHSVLRPAAPSPLNAHVSRGRVFAGVRTDLEDLRRVRRRHGGTVNDVVLAVVTGALREWLARRGMPLSQTSTVRALVPRAVRDGDTVGGSPEGPLDNRVVPALVELPVGEPDPVLRLRHLSHAMAAQPDADRSVAAAAMLRLGGFAPATMQSLAGRAASSLSGRLFNVVVSNSPGPQRPRYAGPARMTEIYPVMPLARNQALAVGITSYDGGVYVGLNGDRKALSDVDVLAGMVTDALEELKGTIW